MSIPESAIGCPDVPEVDSWNKGGMRYVPACRQIPDFREITPAVGGLVVDGVVC